MHSKNLKIKMKKNLLRLVPFLLVVMAIISTGFSLPKQKKVLVFSKTAGYRHASAIQAGKKGIIEMGQKNKFAVDTSESADVFTPENLKQYTAVVFLCTTGNILDEQQQ